ncbi:Disrupted in renal carcinoma protein 2-like [Exaiptasia diaphana]|nr:Disrupted in renal carcinoma protein 2-like [Exaiptasia diaphana]
METITSTPQLREKSPLLHPNTNEKIQAAELDNQAPPFKTYKRRWYVLALYTAIGLVCNMNWNTWGPISEPCQIAFGWKKWQVLFLSSLASLSVISSSLIMTWLMEKKDSALAKLQESFHL